MNLLLLISVCLSEKDRSWVLRGIGTGGLNGRSLHSRSSAGFGLRGLATTYTQELYFSTLGLRTQTLERQPTSADGTSNQYKELNPRYLASEGEKAPLPATSRARAAA